MKLRLTFLLFLLPILLKAQSADSTIAPIHIGFESDFGRSVHLPNGRTIFKNEGNVVYTDKENGATISCDSSYHYIPSDTIEFFSNVVVQHENTLLFGDKVFYDGNVAQVRGRIVEMQNQERKAILRTQNVDYDVHNNKGTYNSGGTLMRLKDTIESINGEFDGNTGIFTFIDDVAMKNDSLTIVCDTMHYDTHNDVTTFVDNITVWNGNNFMQSQYGWYKPNDNKMHFSKQAYIQMQSQEVWADSVFFDQLTKNGTLYNNVQIIDTAQTAIIFGDKADLNNDIQKIVISQNPSALYYNIPQNERQVSDTTFLSADTICSYMENYIPPKKEEDKALDFTPSKQPQTQNQGSRKGQLKALDEMQKGGPSVAIVDIDTIDYSKNNALQTSTESAAFGENAVEKSITSDSSKINLPKDSTNVGSVGDSIVVAKDSATFDTITRSMAAYGNVKIYKSDFQALCDSMVYHTLDSTTHMYHNPILWNDSTQITSGPSAFYSKNGEFDYAEFSEPAIAGLQEDSIHFSQMKGKKMKAYFSKNQIYKIDVIGNGQSVYYIREKDTLPVTAVEISECANIRINIKQNKIRRVAYLMKPTSNTYPLEKVPEEADKLKDFVWHESIRPKNKNDVFKRKIHSRKRVETQAIEKPRFEITDRINSLINQKQ